MTTPMQADREAVAQLVSETLPCTAYYPERINPNSALIQAAQPYLTNEDATYGHLTINLEIRVIVPHGTNEAQTNALDELAHSITIDLINANRGVQDVSQPYTLLHGDRKYTAISIITSNQIKL